MSLDEEKKPNELFRHAGLIRGVVATISECDGTDQLSSDVVDKITAVNYVLDATSFKNLIDRMANTPLFTDMKFVEWFASDFIRLIGAINLMRCGLNAPRPNTVMHLTTDVSYHISRYILGNSEYHPLNVKIELLEKYPMDNIRTIPHLTFIEALISNHSLDKDQLKRILKIPNNIKRKAFESALYVQLGLLYKEHHDAVIENETTLYEFWKQIIVYTTVMIEDDIYVLSKRSLYGLLMDYLKQLQSELYSPELYNEYYALIPASWHL